MHNSISLSNGLLMIRYFVSDSKGLKEVEEHEFLKAKGVIYYKNCPIGEKGIPVVHLIMES